MHARFSPGPQPNRNGFHYEDEDVDGNGSNDAYISRALPVGLGTPPGPHIPSEIMNNQGIPDHVRARSLSTKGLFIFDKTPFQMAEHVNTRTIPLRSKIDFIGGLKDPRFDFDIEVSPNSQIILLSVSVISAYNDTPNHIKFTLHNLPPGPLNPEGKYEYHVLPKCNEHCINDSLYRASGFLHSDFVKRYGNVNESSIRSSIGQVPLSDASLVPKHSVVVEYMREMTDMVDGQAIELKEYPDGNCFQISTKVVNAAIDGFLKQFKRYVPIINPDDIHVVLERSDEKDFDDMESYMRDHELLVGSHAAQRLDADTTLEEKFLHRPIQASVQLKIDYYFS